MRKLIFRALCLNLAYVLALTLVLISCSSSETAYTPEDLGRHLAKTIVQKDFSRFTQRFLDKTDYEYISAQQRQWYTAKNSSPGAQQLGSGTTEHQRTVFLKAREEKLKEVRLQFDHLIGELEKAKINVSQLKFEGISRESTNNRRGVETLDLFVTLSEGKSKTVIRVAGCVKSKRGWVYGEAPKLDSNTQARPG